MNFDKFKDLPVIGTNGQLYTEEIIALAPDVIVMSKSASVKAATIQLPEKARLFDSYICACCGETTGANWIRMAEGKTLCLDCYESYDRFAV